MLGIKLFNLLEKAMDGSALKHTAISNNIANVNTPGYKKLTVSFHQSLEKYLEEVPELKTTKNKHFTGKKEMSAEPVIRMTQAGTTKLRNDGNNVDIDLELAALAENNLYFNSLAQLLSAQIALLKHSISEGRR